MSTTRAAKGRVSRAQSSVGVRVWGFVALSFLMAAVVILLPSWIPAQQSVGSPPIVAATPLPSVSPTPAFTPTPTPTPTPTTPGWVNWTFQGATVTVPKAGINNVGISELQPNELVQKTYLNAAGSEVTYEAVEPSSKMGVTWDTTVVDGVRSPVGSVLSASAANTVYLYCHDYADGTALCSNIYDVTTSGDVMTVQTPTEVLAYVAQESFTLRKGELPNDPRVTAVGAGRLLVITCNSGGERNALGETMENSVIVFQLVPPTG